MSKTSGPKPGVILGAGAKPPFAVLPDPSSPFLHRARRFASSRPCRWHGTAGSAAAESVLGEVGHVRSGCVCVRW
jgi:hypothetical protein